MHRLLFTTLCCFLFWGCEKKIIEYIPVFDYQDISIPNTEDLILDVSFSGNVGCACPYERDYIYLTKDGGASWEQQQLTSNSTWTCEAVGMTSADVGYALMGERVYVTRNGGDSWSVARQAETMDVNSDGQVFIAEYNNAWYYDIFESTDDGQSWNIVGTVPQNGHSTLDRMKACGRRIMLYGDFTPFEYHVQGWDDETNQVFSVWWESAQTHGAGYMDVYMTSNVSGYCAGTNGMAGTVNDGSCYRLQGEHNGFYYHVYEHAGTVMAVGGTSLLVLTNRDGEQVFDEVFDPEGNGWTEQNLINLQFMGNDEIVVCGGNGLVYQGKVHHQ